jgi:hypothetical protein
MDLDRLPIKTLFGRFGGQPPPGRPQKTCLEYVRDDLSRLSELHGILATYRDWCRLCRDRNEWTKKIGQGSHDGHLVLGLETCNYSIIQF